MRGIFIVEYYSKTKQYIDAENILSLEYVKEMNKIKIIYKTPCELPDVLTGVCGVGYYSDYQNNVNVNI